MTKSFSVEIVDANLHIEEMVWTDLQADTGFAVSTVATTVLNTVKRGGAVVVHRDGGDVLRKFDRVSEVNDWVREVNERRERLGIDPISP